MEPEGSFPHSQMPATCPYPEPAPCSPHPNIPLHEDHLNIILPSMIVLPSGLFLWGFPTKTLFTTFLSPYALHAQPILFFLI